MVLFTNVSVSSIPYKCVSHCLVGALQRRCGTRDNSLSAPAGTGAAARLRVFRRTAFRTALSCTTRREAVPWPVFDRRIFYILDSSIRKVPEIQNLGERLRAEPPTCIRRHNYDTLQRRGIYGATWPNKRWWKQKGRRTRPRLALD